MLPGRRQLLLYTPRAAHLPPLRLHLSSPLHAEKPPPALGDITAPSGSSHALGTGAHPASPRPKPAGGMLQAQEEPHALLEGGSASLTTWERSIFRWGLGLGTKRKDQKCKIVRFS